MRQGLKIGCFGGLKSALVIAVIAGIAAVSAVNPALAGAKLIYAANSSPVKDAVEVLRGRAIEEQPEFQEIDLPVLAPYPVISAGNGWLYNQVTGRLISCYRISTGYVGEREIRCTGVTLY